MTRAALIGHTGFVGSNLDRQMQFDARYNSGNIESIAGKSYDLVVCAGARAEKWIANANPEADAAGIDRLLSALSTVRARKLVLISTVDVFLIPIAVNEDTFVTAEGLNAYGLNRLHLELELARRFKTVILRLPGLYGRGIKKNVVHDLLKAHETEKIDSRGIFQFYNLDRLSRDMRRAIGSQLNLVHLTTEPVSVEDVARESFGMSFINHVSPSPARYDVRTKHAAIFGGEGNYLENRTAELEGIRLFVDRERRVLPSDSEAPAPTERERPRGSTRKPA
jgi:nucleoside-diphosphate-sugar epimerase